jgi:Carbohydrate binding domain (family 11)
VEYPIPTADPAGRDVRCAAENRDWTGGRAISFQIRPAHAMRLSVSFVDRNLVAYTAWTDLKAGVSQLIRIPFDEIRPNPFFQPPGAKTGAPLDVSDVKGIAFAPQDPTSGRLAIGRFVVSK